MHRCCAAFRLPCGFIRSMGWSCQRFAAFRLPCGFFLWGMLPGGAAADFRWLVADSIAGHLRCPLWRIVHLPHASLSATSFDLRSSLASVRSWWGYQRIAAAQLSGCRADLSARWVGVANAAQLSGCHADYFYGDVNRGCFLCGGLTVDVFCRGWAGIGEAPLMLGC